MLSKFQMLYGKIDDMMADSKNPEVVMSLVLIKKLLKEHEPHRTRKVAIKKATNAIEEYIDDMKSHNKRVTVLALSKKFKITVDEARKILK